MRLALSSDSLKEKIAQKIEFHQNVIEEYEDQRNISIHLQDYVAEIDPALSVEIEPEVKSDKEGTIKHPDLLILGTKSSLILDVKRIQSTDGRTLQHHLDDMLKYNQRFVFESRVISPEVLLLCPPRAAHEFRKLQQQLQYPIHFFSYHIDDSIVITPISGKVQDDQIGRCINTGITTAQKPSLTSTYRVLKSDPPLLYLCEIVYANLWTNRSTFHKDTFVASKSNMYKMARVLYLPFIKSKNGNRLEQLVPSRVDSALAFLEKIDWIEFRGKDDIIVKVNHKFFDARKYLVKELSEIEARRELSHERRELRKMKREEQKRDVTQLTLDDSYGNNSK